MEPATEFEEEKIVDMEKFDSTWTIARKKFIKNKIAMISLCLLLFIIAFSFLGPFILTDDITRIHTDKSNLEPSSEHWFGTDRNGRDMFLRTIHGGKVSLTIGIVSMFAVTIIGSTIGAIAGYFGGMMDNLIMRFTDFVLTIPFTVFIIVLNTILLGYERVTGMWSLIIVFSLLGWGSVARIVRSKILSEKENEYVLAAKSIGTKSSKIISRHLIPNVMTIIIVQATLLLALYIVAEAGLSFIGVGVPPDTPSWGNMLMEARQTDVLKNKPWIWVPPAVCITLTILSINFVGEGLKDAFDPKTTK
ncbi:oligopeptide ABC transporter permease [Pseudogracilibacillus auburnensis]|uniref:Peptide/nickel transport system permease protein n=1 Tax=Pseudogracilibacillus auburnensis TaxID=1494959 RepID=A0A2V3W239_9BACI|nr:oligopeptide ABC transporter permease [Pseudogracilibacillus auburnensis]PXW87980.1 peptide/nickel transport system permease protein [Pseudogracilibacillus auburnensis]